MDIHQHDIRSRFRQLLQRLCARRGDGRDIVSEPRWLLAQMEGDDAFVLTLSTRVANVLFLTPVALPETADRSGRGFERSMAISP